MEFKVQRSWASILAFNLFFVFLTLITIPFAAYNTWVFIIIFLICLGLLVLYNTSIIFASCSVSKKTITYRTGIFKYVIELSTIKRIHKNTSYDPSLATSPTRVRIVTKKDGKQKVYYVSVVDREKFIDVVKSKAGLVEEKIEKIQKKQPKTKKVEEKKEATSANKKTDKKPSKKPVSKKK